MALAALCGAAGIAFSPCGGPARAEHFSNGCDQGRRIALTFDDGPNPPWSGRILDILTQHDARATFFLEGEALNAHPEIARGERDAGMGIGAHSFSHRQDLPSLGAAEFRDDLDHTSDALSAALGFVPGIFRAPYGHTSDTMLEVEHERGYASIGWDVDSTDWKDSTPDEIVEAVLDGAHPGAIVLMHDGGLGGGDPDRSRTAEALPRIIDGLREQGYAFVTVPELTGAPARHGDPERAACSAS